MNFFQTSHKPSTDGRTWMIHSISHFLYYHVSWKNHSTHSPDKRTRWAIIPSLFTHKKLKPFFFWIPFTKDTVSLDSQFSFFMSEPNFPNSSLMGLSSISLCIPKISIYNNLLKVTEFYQQNKYMKFHVLLTVLGQKYTVSLALQLKYDFEALSWKIWWIWWTSFFLDMYPKTKCKALKTIFGILNII